MITPTHKDVHLSFGPLFILAFLGMVDESAGISAIIDARRTIEVTCELWLPCRGY